MFVTGILFLTTLLLIFIFYNSWKDLVVKARKLRKKISDLLISDDLYDRIKKQEEKNFFLKYANIEGAYDKNNKPFRTITATQFILQAIQSANLGNKLERVNDHIVRLKMPGNFPQNGRVASQSFTSETAACDCTCLPYCDTEVELDITYLETLNSAYESYVQVLMGSDGQLGVVCPCAGGTYCEWNARMLQQFIVNTDEWDLRSVSIFDQNCRLLSSSTFTSLSSTFGSSNYVLVEMTGHAATLNEEWLKVYFEWYDSKQEAFKCVSLCIRNPVEETPENPDTKALQQRETAGVNKAYAEQKELAKQLNQKQKAPKE